MPKYPDITVQLTGKDGNAFYILGICLRAMRRAGLSQEECEAFQAEATSGTYLLPAWNGLTSNNLK